VDRDRRAELQVTSSRTTEENLGVWHDASLAFGVNCSVFKELLRGTRRQPEG
jgi:hypothetical protein